MNTIIFYVRDIEKTKRFYDLLGMPIEEVKKGHCKIRLGSIELEFHDENFETIAEFKAESQRHPKGAGLYFYFRNDDLESYREELRRNNITVISEISERPWGNMEFIVSDPDGYNLVFYRKC